MKMNESEKIDKYLDLARTPKKQWNMRTTVIPVVVGSLGMVSKGLKKDRKEWKSAKDSRQHYENRLTYPEESWKPKETCSHALSKRPLNKTGVKNLQEVK